LRKALIGNQCARRLFKSLWHSHPHGDEKLTKAEKLVNEQTLAMLEWAAEHTRQQLGHAACG
jgi:hypothetical protein